LPAYQEEQPAAHEDEQKLRRPAEEAASNLPGRSSTGKNIISSKMAIDSEVSNIKAHPFCGY